MLNYSFNGTDSTLGQITDANAYKLYAQEGRKAALSVAYKLIHGHNGKYFSSNAFGTSQANTETQYEFLMSTTKNAKIAMMFEGGWWENEAKGTFKEMADLNQSYAYGERNFGFMPVPRVESGDFDGISGQTSTDRTMFLSQEGSAICVRSTTTNMELCKLFIQYLHTQENLAYFNATTGVFKPYEYTMTDSQINSLTSFSDNFLPPTVAFKSAKQLPYLASPPVPM